MAAIKTRHQVDAANGTLYVRLAVCVDGKDLKAVQAPMTVDEARRLRDDLDDKIREAGCQPPPKRRAASSASGR
jgi:hypothetical protein